MDPIYDGLPVWIAQSSAWLLLLCVATLCVLKACHTNTFSRDTRTCFTRECVCSADFQHAMCFQSHENVFVCAYVGAQVWIVKDWKEVTGANMQKVLDDFRVRNFQLERWVHPLFSPVRVSVLPVPPSLALPLLSGSSNVQMRYDYCCWYTPNSTLFKTWNKRECNYDTKYDKEMIIENSSTPPCSNFCRYALLWMVGENRAAACITRARAHTHTHTHTQARKGPKFPSGGAIVKPKPFPFRLRLDYWVRLIQGTMPPKSPDASIPWVTGHSCTHHGRFESLQTLKSSELFHTCKWGLFAPSQLWCHRAARALCGNQTLWTLFLIKLSLSLRVRGSPSLSRRARGGIAPRHRCFPGPGPSLKLPVELQLASASVAASSPIRRANSLSTVR